jgi:hypothetical protein
MKGNKINSKFFKEEVINGKGNSQEDINLKCETENEKPRSSCDVCVQAVYLYSLNVCQSDIYGLQYFCPTKRGKKIGKSHIICKFLEILDNIILENILM